jgi:hypothetical protein
MTMISSQAVSLDFKIIKDAVANQFARMSKHQMYRTGYPTNVEGEDAKSNDEIAAQFRQEIWDKYLASFPEGSNPIFRERTEHDCSCCRSFIKNIGNTVTIENGQLVSVWDVKVDGAYQVVCDALSAFVKSQPIVDVFLSVESKAGVDKTYEDMVGGIRTWRHFFVNIPPQFVVQGKSLGESLNGPRQNRAVFLRGLTELTQDAFDTVLDLLARNSLYVGGIVKPKETLQAFLKVKKEFDKLDNDADRAIFAWEKLPTLHVGAATIRNTALGTLLIDLSAGMEMEDAVKKFETSIMAPTNYKRPTALISPKQAQALKDELIENNLLSALDRRHTDQQEVSINNLLFSDNSARAVITNDAFDDVIAGIPQKVKKFDKVQEIPLDKFLKDVLPTAKTVEILFENRLVGNLFSLITAANPTANKLFKWDNHYSWAYKGEVADSIKERVKAAGGNVSGDLCCRLAWNNGDDLDFHMQEPGFEIYFGNKGRFSPNGGMLDVDMNAGGAHNSKDPVENIFYPDKSRMREGTYKLQVHQYSRRDSRDPGFEVEIDFMGTVYRFVYEKAMGTGANVTVAEFRYTKAVGVEIIKSLPMSSSTKSQTAWGLVTQQFHKVNAIMKSPNAWEDDAIGNEHIFFVMDGAKNDEQPRGYFNEFVRGDLEKHRKALEFVGGKMKVPDSDVQTSGLGFSKTQPNKFIVRVTGAYTQEMAVVV